MASTEHINKSFERNRKALKIKPSMGQNTGQTKVYVRDGTTCNIENGKWKFTVDVGETDGGNNAGPGPGVSEGAALGSCLAIGYSKWAAYLGVPIDGIQVEVESDIDARASFGIGEEAFEAIFVGGPVAMAYHRFDNQTRQEAMKEYLESIEPFRNEKGYEIPGEFVIGSGVKC